MHRLALVVLLAACGGSGTEQSTAVPMGERPARVTVTLFEGSLEVANGDEIRIEARSPRSGEIEELLQAQGGRDVLSIAPPEAAREWPIDARITLPAGIDLGIVTRGASVDVAGRWGTVRVRTQSGAATVRVDGLAGATVKTTSGRIDFETRTVPEAEVSCTSTSGDVSVRVPAAFTGGVQVSGAPDRVTVPEHPRHARMMWGPERRNVKGWVGDVPAQEQIDDPDWKQRPSVFARTTEGAADFRLLD